MLIQWLEKQQGTLFHPFFSLSLILFFFLLFFLVIRSHKGSCSASPSLPPSPPKLPIIGNLHQLSKLIHHSLRDLSQKYGPIMFLHFGCTPVVVVSSKELAKEIMKNQDVVFANRPFTMAAKMIFYGCKDIAFSPYGECWRQLRKICAMKLLSVKKVQSFKFVREEEVGLMLEQISRSCSLEAPINLSEIVFNFSKDVIIRCALGRKYGEDGDKRWGELPRKISMLLASFSFQDFFPSLGWMDVITGLVRRLRRTTQELDTFFDQVIEEHLIQQKQGDIDKEDDFVDLLLQDHKLDINLTRDNIKAIIVDIFAAGIETSATTIEWAIAELIRNPNAMRKAQEEVRGVIGRKNKVEEEDIPQMDYLNCVIKETLRLHPAGPLLLPRESYASTNVGGYHIPHKTRVLINAWAIQRDPESWIEAEKFIPERFVGRTIDFEGQELEFIPFGSGRRICPGMSFGLASVEIVVTNLLYWFDWELPGDANEEALDMTEAFGLGLRKKIPLHLVPILHCS